MEIRKEKWRNEEEREREGRRNGGMKKIKERKGRRNGGMKKRGRRGK